PTNTPTRVPGSSASATPNSTATSEPGITRTPMPTPIATQPPSPNAKVDVSLSVERLANTDVVVGRQMAYAVKVTNLGSGPASAITLVNALPSNAKFKDAQPGPGFECLGMPSSSTGGTLVCDIPAGLPPGASSIVNVVIVPASAGKLHHSLNIVTLSQESNVSNNAIDFDLTALEAQYLYFPLIRH
nr:DUF11 domain-containing protein [Anaerolineae bacterium]